MHMYSSSTIKRFGDALKEKTKASTYDIYSNGKYKYIHLKYYDSINSYNIDQYYTIMNGYGYTILAQKVNEFSTLEELTIKKIVNSTVYKYIPEYEKKPKSNYYKWEKIIVTIALSGVIGGFSALFNKNKKKPS